MSGFIGQTEMTPGGDIDVRIRRVNKGGPLTGTLMLDFVEQIKEDK